jgi:pyruvate dehydrogenase E2 component (dihydrolipoamide acetyltransferase)
MRGLIVPVMRDAGRKNLAEVTHLRQEMVERAMAGTVRPEELSGGTFTLTNLGVMGVDHFTPILNPPQVAILGIGRIRKVPAIHKGRIRKRRIMGLALSCDHRVIDGGPAARFLSDLSAYIENPDKIRLDSLFGD